MAIKIQGSTIIDDSRNIVSAGIATINTKIDVGAGGTIFSADANVSNDNILSVKNTSLNPALDITGIGSVGIGITNPSKSLHVDGTGLLVASGSTTLFSVESFTPNSNVFEVYDRENSIILGVSTNSVGIGSTNIFTITPQVTQTAIGIGTDELITLAPNSGSDNIFQVTNASGSIKHFVVANNGNIGVGTTNPSQKLHIDGNFLVSDGSTEVLEVNGSSGNPLSIQNSSLNPAFDVTGIGSVGIGTTQPSAIFEVVSGGTEIFRISDTLSDNYLEIDTDKFVINSSGNAGIGTDNPGTKLEISAPTSAGAISNALSLTQTGTGSGTGTRLLIGYDTAIGTYGSIEGFYDGTGTSLTFGTSNNAGISQVTERLRITGAGLVGIGTTNPQAKLDIWGGSANTTYFRGGTGNVARQLQIRSEGTITPGAAHIFNAPSVSGTIIFETSNTEALRIDSSQRIGIGSASPSQLLDVNGNARLRGALYDFNNVPGNPGELLTTTGTGVSWTASTVEVNVNEISSGSYYIGAFETTGTTAQAYIETTNPVVLTSEGNLGIGTDAPEYDLDIGGSVNATTPKNAGVGTVRIAAQLGIGHTDLTRSTAKPSSTYGGVLTLGGDYSTGDNPIIIFDAYPASSTFNNILIGDSTTGNALAGGNGNVFVGGGAGPSVTGNYNIAIGPQAVDSSTGGDSNYGIGYRTLFAGSGNGNVAFGREAGNGFGSGGASYNTFLGYGAGNNTTGAPATGDYDHNIIIGSGNGNEGFFAPKGGDKQLAIGGHRSGEDPFYWIVGDENLNIGIGTTNPSGAVDPNNTTILNAGIVTANFYYGDGSGLTNLPASPSSNGEFYTGISSSVQITPLSYETSVFTFPSTAGKQYVIESINVANVDTSVGVGTTINIIASIEDSTGEQTYIAYNVPIVTGGLIELLKNPIVAGPSDVIKMWTTNETYTGVGNAGEVYMNYTEFTSTDYISKFASTVSVANTNTTTLYTSTGNPTLVEKIGFANRTDTGDYPISIKITNGVTTTYLAKNLIIPRYSTVDILDRPKRIETGATIDVEVGSTSTIDIIIAGKKIT